MSFPFMGAPSSYRGLPRMPCKTPLCLMASPLRLNPSLTVPPTYLTVPCSGTRAYLTMPEDSYLRALVQLDRLSPQFPGQLCDILDGNGFDDCVKNLEAEDLLWLIEFLDKVWFPLDSKNHSLNQP